MRTIRLQNEVSAKVVATRKGTYVGPQDYDFVLGNEDVDVLMPNGQLVLVHRVGVLPPERKDLSDIFGKLRDGVNGRGAAVHRNAHLPVSRKDGSVSVIKRVPQLQSLKGAASVVLGYQEADGRNAYCRPSAYTAKHPKVLESVLPWLQELSKQFQIAAPEWFQQQSEFAKQVPAWILSNTVFCALTINRNWQSALHLDDGDYGAVVITALTSGTVQGGILVFPQLRLGVQLLPGNILIAPMGTLWHGNTPLFVSPGSLRLTFVAYLRTKLLACGSKAVEQARRDFVLAQRKFVTKSRKR